MKLAIVGSRKFKHLIKVANYVRALPRDTIVISGGAVGVDSQAVIVAKTLGMEVVVYPADWEMDGRKAGFIRNTVIVDVCDQLVAFWDGKSHGTIDVISKAQVAGKLKEVIDDE